MILRGAYLAGGHQIPGLPKPHHRLSHAITKCRKRRPHALCAVDTSRPWPFPNTHRIASRFASEPDRTSIEPRLPRQGMRLAWDIGTDIARSVPAVMYLCTTAAICQVRGTVLA